MKGLVGIVLAVVLLVPGCIDEEDFVAPTLTPIEVGLPSEKDPRLPASATSPRVVVALIDSGVNPYHDWFQRADSLSDDVLGALVDDKGQPPVKIGLSRDGNWTERVSTDHDLLRSLKPGQLYYFEGTNVLGVSFRDVPDDEDQFLFLTGGSHGTMTSGAVVQNNPNAIVVMAQGDYDRAEKWVAERPWIDVVSMSYGPPGSIPGTAGPVNGLYTHVNTKLMWQKGKVPVGAADNSAAFAPNDETAGPPWVIGVSGDNSTTGCRSHNSGTAPDFTSDFTQRLPRWNDTTNTSTASGTSFSTPKTASTFSRVIYEARVSWGHIGGIDARVLADGPEGKQLTFETLRAAFNLTARYFDSSACQPQPGTNLPVNPAAPWTQQGWGHVGPEIVEATIAHLLGTKAAPAKSDEAEAYQQSMYRYRETLWSRI